MICGKLLNKKDNNNNNIIIIKKENLYKKIEIILENILQDIKLINNAFLIINNHNNLSSYIIKIK